MCIPIGVIKWILHDKNENLFEANWPTSFFDEEIDEYD